MEAPGGYVIRSAEQLVALSSKADSAKDPAVQKEMETDLARLLQMDAIDWSTAGGANVIVSGAQVYDNKGRVVEKYEPYFSAGWESSASLP